MKADIIQGLTYGDEAKSKVCNEYLKKRKYSHCLRFSGGSNAGHTVYLEGKKVVTHCIPTGVLQGVKSIIGPGCVVNERMFFEELEVLERVVPGVSKNVKIAQNVHITTTAHLLEEAQEKKIGTTKKGIGPTYRDKYARVGVRAESIPGLKDFVIDIYEELHNPLEEVYVMCEGAQAIGLDIDWGKYPYVTSSHCGVGGVINNGIPYTAIQDVIGVAKCYDTYVGAYSYQDPRDDVLTQLGDVGNEYGATTGRRRQVNYLDFDMLKKHIGLTGTNVVILNKLDVVKEVDVWKMFFNKTLIDLSSEESFKYFIRKNLSGVEVIFSSSPYHI